jgi:hypothetical protein
MSKFTHTFDVCFTVKSDSEDPANLKPQEYLAGMAWRLAKLMKEETDQSHDVTEAFGYIDTVES